MHAARRRRYRALGVAAHQLKGQLGYIAAKQAQQAAARLESSAKALADSDGAAFLLDETREALRILSGELDLVRPAVETALREVESGVQ